MLFDCLNYASGRLDPSYETLGRLANISVRSVARGLAKLKAAGVLNWLRRCVEGFKDGRFALEQETIAYAVLPASQCRGYAMPPPTPPPDLVRSTPLAMLGAKSACALLRALRAKGV